MIKIRMIRTGMTLNREVRIQGEILELSPNIFLSIDAQKAAFRDGKIRYVEVDSPEDKAILAVGMNVERDVFTADKTIVPGFAPADEENKDIVTEQVPVQPTEAEIEDSMVGNEEDDEDEEDEDEEDEEDISQLTRKELRGVIEEEELEVDYSNSTNRTDLIAGIVSAREE